MNRNYAKLQTITCLTSTLDYIAMEMRKNSFQKSCFTDATFFLLQTFFEALGRVKEIHKDCKLLLRTKQQTAG